MVSFSVGRRRRRFVPGDEVFASPGVREPAVLDHRGSGSCHYSSSSRVYIHLEHAMSNECREVTREVTEFGRRQTLSDAQLLH